MNNSVVVEKDTRSEAGERVLPLPGPLVEALKKFRACRARERLALGRDYLDSGYVTVDESGSPQSEWTAPRPNRADEPA
ncbi:hypothetical protein [Streptomyces sp. NPDC046197]|uniref:hypothetical protein n=1 Tax=Streptomyces sp. NPDC046197 TaxID=3154337 RepID=UPI0033D54DF1